MSIVFVPHIRVVFFITLYDSAGDPAPTNRS